MYYMLNDKNELVRKFKRLWEAQKAHNNKDYRIVYLPNTINNFRKAPNYRG